jgi:hypothetical protein
MNHHRYRVAVVVGKARPRGSTRDIHSQRHMIL